MFITQISRFISTRDSTYAHCGHSEQPEGRGNRARSKLVCASAIACGLLLLGGAQVASAESPRTKLNAGETLRPGEELRSPHGQFFLVMQKTDGNLVEYQQGMPGALWQAETTSPPHSEPGARAEMQEDGNFVVQGQARTTALWNAGYFIGYKIQPKSFLSVQDDGNVVLYSPSGAALWATYSRPKGGPPGNMYQVTGTGGTLAVRTTPSLSAGTVGEMRDGTWVHIVCQTPSDNVVKSAIWDKIDSPYVGYVADWYITTPAVGHYSPGIQTCLGAPTPQPLPTPQYTELRNAASVRCLDADTGTIGSNGTKVQLWDCSGNANQDWSFGADGTIRNQASGRCLEGGPATSGPPGTLHLYDCNGSPSQQWTLEAYGTIRNQASGRVLDADTYTIASNGTKVQLATALGWRNQAWYMASPAALPQASNYKYCAPSMKPVLVFGQPRDTDIKFAPCISVSDTRDGNSVAMRSIQPSGCQSYTFVLLEALNCYVTEQGSHWNGYANVDYVKMNLTWTSDVVAYLGYGGQSLSTICETEDDVTLEVETSPYGSPKPSQDDVYINQHCWNQ
jgi:Ricin-type beta-trefoil lectin domain